MAVRRRRPGRRRWASEVAATVHRRAPHVVAMIVLAVVLGMVTLAPSRHEGLSVLGAAADADGEEPLEPPPVEHRGPPADRQGRGAPACTGPPPWARTPARDGGSRSGEARAFSQWRESTCPDGDAEEAGRAGVRQGPPDHAAGPGKDVPGPPAGREGAGELACTGPPPWAGTPARDAGTRGREAQAFSQWREANCPDDLQDADAPPAP